MAKLIVRFMTVVLELVAALFLIGGGISGIGYAIDYANEGENFNLGLSFFLSLFTVPLGVAAGFIAATIILGIPMLILRINQNLEEINKTLKEINPTSTDSKQSTPQVQDIDPFN